MENDEEEKLIKVDESELPGDQTRLRIAKEDIELDRFFIRLCRLQCDEAGQDCPATQ